MTRHHNPEMSRFIARRPRATRRGDLRFEALILRALSPAAHRMPQRILAALERRAAASQMVQPPSPCRQKNAAAPFGSGGRGD
jgi:hypothetical protein